MRSDNDSKRGLYNKYDIVHRADGSSEPGGKHSGCRYFVLDLTHDEFARPALLAYADACEARFPLLAADLRQTPVAFEGDAPAVERPDDAKMAEIREAFRRCAMWSGLGRCMLPPMKDSPYCEKHREGRDTAMYQPPTPPTRTPAVADAAPAKCVGGCGADAVHVDVLNIKRHSCCGGAKCCFSNHGPFAGLYWRTEPLPATAACSACGRRKAESLAHADPDLCHAALGTDFRCMPPPAAEPVSHTGAMLAAKCAHEQCASDAADGRPVCGPCAPYHTNVGRTLACSFCTRVPVVSVAQQRACDDATWNAAMEAAAKWHDGQAYQFALGAVESLNKALSEDGVEPAFADSAARMQWQARHHREHADAVRALKRPEGR